MASSWGWMSTFWAVYTGAGLGSLNEVACRSYGDTGAFLAVAGVTYFIQVGSLYNDGGWLTFQLKVAPPPTVDFYYYPYDPSSFDTVEFNTSWNDPANVGGDTFTWNFGDGATATGSSAYHHYAVDGNYTVTHGFTTYDGRSASVSKTITVRTHDVAIIKFTVPNSASAGQTRGITVGIKNLRYAERVRIELYRSTPSGYVYVGWLEMTVPVRSGNRTTDFNFSYTFTSEDAKIGKVTFKAVATIQDARDALPADNEAISQPVKVSR